MKLKISEKKSNFGLFIHFYIDNNRCFYGRRSKTFSLYTDMISYFSFYELIKHLSTLKQTKI